MNTESSDFAQRLMQRGNSGSVSGEVAVIYETTDGSFLQVDIPRLEETLGRKPMIADALEVKDGSARNRQVKLIRDGITSILTDAELGTREVQAGDKIMLYERQTGA